MIFKLPAPSHGSAVQQQLEGDHNFLLSLYLLFVLTQARRPDEVTLRSPQLAGRGTKERARLGWPFFVRKILILKIMMFRDVTTVLNERKHVKMVIRSLRSVPDSLSLILGRAE